jgi:hypothetical protein
MREHALFNVHTDHDRLHAAPLSGFLINRFRQVRALVPTRTSTAVRSAISRNGEQVLCLHIAVWCPACATRGHVLWGGGVRIGRSIQDTCYRIRLNQVHKAGDRVFSTPDCSGFVHEHVTVFLGGDGPVRAVE